MQTPLTTGVNSNLFSYQYDAAGRLKQVQFPWSNGIWKHAYQNNGWLYHTTGPSAPGSIYSLAESSYSYNARGFLTSLSNYTSYNDQQYGDTGQNGPAYSGMTYDALGNRLGEIASLPPMATNIPDPNNPGYYSRFGLLADASHTLSYGYDTANGSATSNRDVMTGETSVLSGAASSSFLSRYKNAWTHGFGYDPAYNPTRYDYFDRSSGTDLTYSGLGYTSDNQHSASDFGSTFSFDGNGNPTTYKNAGFSFDPEDRLTSITSPAFAATYDGNGLRATKTAGGVTTYFVYDGSNPVVEETWNGTSATVTATNGFVADGWRTRYEGTIAYDYLYDPQGNLVERQSAADYAGVRPAYDQTIYEAYGALRSDTKIVNGPGGGSATTPRDPIGFGGQYGYYTDNETGLLCLTHRYYDPGTGRFINRDPIGYEGGVNLYGFAGGNPVNDSDPSGLISTTDREDSDRIEMMVLDGVTRKDATNQVTSERAKFDAQRREEAGRGYRFFEVATSLIGGGEIGVISEGRTVITFAKALFGSIFKRKASQAIVPVVKIGYHTSVRMAEREITRDMISITLRRGQKFWDTKNKVMNYVLKNGMGSGKDLLVGQNPITGKITTVIRGENLVNKRFIPIK